MFTLPCTHIYPHALCHCPAEPASLPARDALPCPGLSQCSPHSHPVTPPIPKPATPERAREKKKERERDGAFL